MKVALNYRIHDPCWQVVRARDALGTEVGPSEKTGLRFRV